MKKEYLDPQPYGFLIYGMKLDNTIPQYDLNGNMPKQKPPVSIID